MSRNRGEPGRKKVLVVEDEKLVRDYVVSVLAQNGYEVMAVESAEQAADAFLEHGDGIGLVFSDINLPGRTGVDLMNDIRMLKPEMPFIMSSADPCFTEYAAATGCAFVSKPHIPDILLQTVHREINMPDARSGLAERGC